MMAVIYAFMCALLICTSADGLRCLKCSHVISPIHCHTMELCKQNEVCLVEKYTTTTATKEILFNVGCAAHSDVSHQNVSSSILIQNIDTDNPALKVDCKEYCTSDVCNSAGCGYQGYHRGPLCYNCPQSRDISNCNIVGVCAENELCHVVQIDELGEQYFTTSCINKQLCDRNIINSIIGKREYSNRDALRIMCSKCCHDDLCNFECNQGKSESTTVMSTPAQQPHTQTTTSTVSQGNSESTTAMSTPAQKPHTQTTTSTVTSATTTKSHSQYKGHSGSSFWIAFPTVYDYSNRNSIKIKLTVLASSAVSTTISTATSTSHYLTDAANKSIDLPYTLIENYNIVEDKGVLVTTNTSASVYAFTSYDNTYYSDMSWVPSSDRLGTSYIAISYNRSSSSYPAYINIISIYPSTIVNVTLNTTGGVTYNGSIYRNGDVLTLNLNQYNSIQVSSDKDITGSKIESNLPVMVQSGMSKFVGPNVAWCASAASIYEVPVPAWGRTFTVPPIQTAMRYAIRIVPSKQSTVLSVRSKHTVNTYTLSSTLVLNFDASEMLVITCHDPCFVAQYPASKSDVSVTSYMVTVPAVEQYSRDFNMISPDFLPYKSHFISIMIKSDEASGLLLNGTTVYDYNVNVQSITESNNTWSVMSITVPQGTHKVTHTSSHTVYGVIGYGFGSCISYGYVAGLNI